MEGRIRTNEGQNKMKQKALTTIVICVQIAAIYIFYKLTKYKTVKILWFFFGDG